jgi:hypothetical protein
MSAFKCKQCGEPEHLVARLCPCHQVIWQLDAEAVSAMADTIRAWMQLHKQTVTEQHLTQAEVNYRYHVARQ